MISYPRGLTKDQTEELEENTLRFCLPTLPLTCLVTLGISFSLPVSSSKVGLTTSFKSCN